MVEGLDPCSKGRGFKFQYRILDGRFSHQFVENSCDGLKRPKINEKEVGDVPFKNDILTK